MKLSRWIRLLLCLFFTVSALAQQLPDKFTNLKVLPKDIGKADLINRMKGFTRALGVRCTACHVGEEGKEFYGYDFPSDDKLTKQNARLMILMVNEINEKTVSKLQMELPPPTVTCWTCHRGKREPETKAPPLPPPPPPPAPVAPPRPTS